jgi:hypothetical protein
VRSPQVGDTVALEAKILFDEGRREGIVTAVADDGMVTAEFPQPGYLPMTVTSQAEHFIVVEQVWEKREAYRIYSRWVKTGDRSSKSVWTAIQEAHAAGRASADSRPNPGGAA